MATITLSKDYGYVLATATSACLISFLHGVRVTILRVRSGVKYPNAYVSAETIASSPPDKKLELYVFNCAQRAHQNCLENLPIVLTGLLVGGWKYPRIATGTGIGWLVCRVIYAFGYTRKDKRDGSGRLIGVPFWWFQFTLLGLLGKTAWDLIVA